MVDYTTPTLVEAEIRASASFDSTTNPLLTTVESWITQASNEIDNLVGDTIGASTYTDEMVDYDGEETLTTKHSPIIAVNSLSYNSSPLGTTGGATWVLKTAETDYSVYEDSGEILLLLNKFSPTSGHKRIKFTYSAGYSVTPPRIQELATKMVAQRVIESLLYNNVDQGNDGGSVSVGSISIVEPSSVGTTTFKSLGSRITELKDEVVKSFSMHRYGHRV